MDYQKDVENDARSFIADHEDMIVDALVNNGDFDYNDMDNLDQEWHDDIIDRSYTLMDAAAILEECQNQETDYGLWERQEPSQAVIIQATYSYANDVWEKCSALYTELQNRFEDSLDQQSPDGGTDETALAKQVFKEFCDEQTKEAIVPVVEGSPEEKTLIEKWFRLADVAGPFWSGYPVGESYIDARCGSGHGMPDVKDFVDFDHEFALRCPWLAGEYKQVVQQRYDWLLQQYREGPRKPSASAPHYGQMEQLQCNTPRRKEAYINQIVETVFLDANLTLDDIRKVVRDLGKRV
jgi:hypothetical protein